MNDTTRDDIAIRVMLLLFQNALDNPDMKPFTVESIASQSYVMADAMELASRKEEA